MRHHDKRKAAVCAAADAAPCAAHGSAGCAAARTVALKARLAAAGAMEVPLDGRCMEPLLRAGDAAVVSAAAGLEVGRIYLACEGGRVVLHRMVGCSDGLCILKGDRTGKCAVVGAGSVVGELSAVRFAGCAHARRWRCGFFQRRIVPALSRACISGVSASSRTAGARSRIVRRTCRAAILAWAYPASAAMRLAARFPRASSSGSADERAAGS